MTRVTYLLSKDPTVEHGGDIALSRLMIEITKTFADVSTICLSGATHLPAEEGLTRVVKPEPSVGLIPRSIAHRRSIVHERYDCEALVPAIRSFHGRTDVWVAEHSYMAETYLRTREPDRRFVINTVNTESQVWKATRGVVGKLQSPIILRDEVRVARAADALGTYEDIEADFYRSKGVTGARWIDLTLPPAQQLIFENTGPRLVFMGTRDWPPNQEAFEIAVDLWPRIAQGIDGAELYIIGAKANKPKEVELPDGVRDLGFVDDLHAFLSTCRALVAPVATGGGVRVKILDAASRGLPVIGTPEAVGSLGPVFGLTAFDDTDAFVEECRHHLLDAEFSRAQGAALFEANAARWSDSVPQSAVQALIAP
ncbi:glycosyltransferase [Williamsia maris]|uniref:Glycosyltransferase involved in cell wall bisynthesis n=1 Tax=Williamsia maris TaxID=72806 RepID=A0ABT1HFS1_9NOCA|nr:glycosyltransferase [Williamsia maris]MCP2177088.1 Glycosyltransferase involved in cell wall bisynthesis [Williamsia maris]